VIELERLVMHALDELGEAEAAVIDEHVLGCGTCASTLERLLMIGGAVRGLVPAGKVSFPVSGALLQELDKAGLISRWYQIAPGRTVACSAEANDIFAATTLETDLGGVAQVDIVMSMHGHVQRMVDVPFDAEQGLVRYLARSDLLRTFPSARIRLELVAVAPSGERRLSEHFLEHTAFKAS
jgi:hypothetical protein